MLKIFDYLKIVFFYTFSHLGIPFKLRVTEKMQKLYSKREPIKPYAFIRLHNEIKTVDIALKSVLPALKGGVIGFHSCSDGTKEYVIEFCKKYPQFIPVEYPYDVIPSGDKRYMNDDFDINSRLDSYYNFIWDKLPKDEWIIKIDGDHIWNIEVLESLCRLPIRKTDCIILSRINLHCDNGKCYIHRKYPIMEGGDSWILYNHNVRFLFNRGWNNGHFFAYERLPLPRKERKKILGICSNWHFPIVKNRRDDFKKDDWVLLKDFDIKEYIKRNKMDGRIQDEMLDEKNILNAFNSFNLSGKKMLP
ncbi:Beta-1,4-N-acetylgalactosaminyltransferase (CgtA) [Haemophilus parahaemolyticus]|uniref:Beta-1,4-N-acetylgalactosaminyltransferase (CgtA) n=1 Tax=Haemophilus parahaemolyticus TaxID=735 RepID=A0A377I163_HAEPH|nr:hypothetical protein [Haemophilus parahaemolyticus]STO63707.1 Beta-1,4-N-acetylgalactosaminyltransferase (CgtA) [Haemophilus parahaemolyticus]